MPLAIIRAGAAILLAPGADVVLADALELAPVSWTTVSLWTEAERNARGVYTVVEVNAELGANQKLGPPVLAFAGEQVTSTRSAVAMSAEEIAARKLGLKAYAASARWNKEQGGIVGPGGIQIATNDASQRKISELRRRVAAGEVEVPFGFKTDSGSWADVNEATIIAIDQAVASHVADCYALERQIDDDIDSGTITTEAAIDDAFAGE